jgi:hypothetical protein
MTSPQRATRSPHADAPQRKPQVDREKAKKAALKEAGGRSTSVYRLDGVVELKGIYFGAEIPKKVDLWNECGLPLRDPIPGTISLGFGYRNRLDLLSAARQYANKKGLDMMVVNVHVKPLSLANEMQWDLLGKREFGMMATDTMPREAQDNLAELWKSWARKDTGMSSVRLDGKANWNSPNSFISAFPKYVPNLMRQWKLQMVAHMAYLEFYDKPLMVATLKAKSVDVAFAEPAIVNAFEDVAIAY